MSKSFIKFQIRYFKAFLKHTSFVARENKTIRNVQTRLSTEWNKVYKDTKFCQGDREVALRRLNNIDIEMKDLYKPFDIDCRFEWKGSLYEKFPHYVRFNNKDGNLRVHHFTGDEMVTAAHILYNKLRHNKTHLKNGDKEHEYIHSLAYWTERLAFLYEERCASQINPKESIIEGRNEAGSSGESVACGGSNHG